jgi:hypothetical protein
LLPTFVHQLPKIRFIDSVLADQFLAQAKVNRNAYDTYQSAFQYFICGFMVA